MVRDVDLVVRRRRKDINLKRVPSRHLRARHRRPRRYRNHPRAAARDNVRRSARPRRRTQRQINYAGYADGGIRSANVSRTLVRSDFAAAVLKQQRHLPTGGHGLIAQHIAGLAHTLHPRYAQHIVARRLLHTHQSAVARPGVQLRVHRHRLYKRAEVVTDVRRKNVLPAAYRLPQQVRLKLPRHLPGHRRPAQPPIDKPLVVQVVRDNPRLTRTLRLVHADYAQVGVLAARAQRYVAHGVDGLYLLQYKHQRPASSTLTLASPTVAMFALEMSFE